MDRMFSQQTQRPTNAHHHPQPYTPTSGLQATATPIPTSTSKSQPILKEIEKRLLHRPGAIAQYTRPKYD